MGKWLSCIMLALTLPLYAQDQELPTLGDGSSSLVSLEQEHRLGRAWLRQMRFYINTLEYPAAREYLENLIYRLAKHSEVADRRFEFILIDTAQLNAFAAPGGIIGVNAGLFLHAQTEHEFAAVMAHELAHLSQRHFARQLEARQKQAPITLASLLGSILLIATNNPEAGFAGLMTTQAAAIQSSLAYSRDWEREADRMGIKTLASADFDPRGMPDMFHRMYMTYRYSELPPEFLLTHPVSESRIADAASRLDGQKLTPKTSNIDFLYIRNEFIGQYKHPSHEGVTYFKQALKQAKSTREKRGSTYGLAIAYKRVGQYFEAKELLQKLLKDDPNRIFLQSAYGNLLIDASRPAEAVKYLEKVNSLSPNNYSLTLTYARALLHIQEHEKSLAILQKLSIERSTDPYIWHLKAQAHKLAKEPIQELQANAESLFLSGETQRAIQQLEYAREKAKGEFQQQARISERIKAMSEDDRLAGLK